MSTLAEGVYQRAITHDDASAFRQRMKQYEQKAKDHRKHAEDRLNHTVATLKQRRQA